MAEFLVYGDAHPGLDPNYLSSSAAKNTLRLVTDPAQRSFELIELRCLRSGDGIVADVIVVDCPNDQVPTRNVIGIWTCERLALVFPLDESRPPSVYALRRDFPVTLHQNHVQTGEPASLCLYFEPWTTVQRTWTPKKHLHRVLWWLSETAKGTLHRTDQPVEQLYFDSPIKLVLPPDLEGLHDNKDYVLTMTAVASNDGSSIYKTLIGGFIKKTDAYDEKVPQHIPIIISLPPILHGQIERYPSTLGNLEDQLGARGASILKSLCEEVVCLIPPTGVLHNPQEFSLLILRCPIKRIEDGPVERAELRAFSILCDLSKLGESLGVLSKHENKYYAVPILGGTDDKKSDSWRDIPLVPIEVKHQVTQTFARKVSGILEETCNFKAVLAGVGALGSSLAELWSREAWGAWTIIDPDYIEPHNIVRHVAKNFLVGVPKAEATKLILEANFFNNSNPVEAISDSILNSEQPKIREAVNSADFLVDATTTLDVPRDISQREDVPRSISAFLTPSGFGSVLLIEDVERRIRLDSLEAQYYRAIINSSWGSDHLSGHSGLWVGAGCRDVSAVISFEMIQLHAANLARQIRILRGKNGSVIRIYKSDPLSGDLRSYRVPVYENISSQCGLWKLSWDCSIKEKLEWYRNKSLPNETGGIILGYIDQKLKTIFLVDILTAPPDSECSPSGFTRGVTGLKDKLEDIAKRTANIVGYVGEWHSHPRYSSARPSSTDFCLINKLATTLALDGQPALMMIVGADGISFTIQENNPY